MYGTSSSIHQSADPVEYFCQRCDEKFYVPVDVKVVCPKCGTDDPKFVVPLSEAESEEEYGR